MKAKRIYKKDITIKMIEYYNNVERNTIREIRIFGRKIGYMRYVNTSYKYEVELFNEYLFVENISQRHYVDNYNELRNLLKGYHIDIDMP